MASTYLSRTPGSAGNRRTWTWSGWCKSPNASGRLFSAGTNISTGPMHNLDFITGSYLRIEDTGSDGLGNNYIELRTNRVFRDVSAWYHIVVAVDTTQATSSDRVKLYVNGVQETSFSTATYPAQNLETAVNMANIHTIGVRAASLTGTYFDGSMSHIHFIDGTAYDASAFGETDATTGIWKPKTAPSVTYGTNGFFLKFENSGAMGTDSSGNANNFTVNGSMTQLIDTPSNVFATMNPLANYYQQSTFSNGNNKMVTATSPYSYNVATMGISAGKYYWEIKYVSANENLAHIGVSGKGETITSTNPLGNNSTDYGYSPDSGGRLYKEGTFVSDSKYSYSIGDIIGIAIDMDSATKTLKLYQNGTLKSTDTISSTPESGFYFPALGHAYSVGQATFETNFGNGLFGTTAVASAQNPDDGIGIFEYSVPAGYKALCTKSINAQEYS